MRKLTGIAIAASLLLGLTGCNNTRSTDEQAVLDTLNNMFLAMSQHDIERSKELLIANGQYHSFNVQTKAISKSSFASYLETLNNKGSTASERLLEPTHIHVMGNVASLTSHYKFFVNDKFSHCGDEVFTFVRNGEKWVITGSVFTVDKSDSCS